ncbi:kinase-like domain-containing protein [Pavlovales sp. CCMP2436]|nr:kinase-like domain-containing protein [Pavlovales sp. CCMP2436]
MADDADGAATAAAASNTAAGGKAHAGANMTNFVEHEHTTTSRGTKLYSIIGMRFETDAKYSVKKAVGQGAYGLVCSAKVAATGDGVAIKKIPKAFDDVIDCKRLLREIKILKHFKHDNVLGIKDIQMPPSKKWKDVYIVSELADTDLHYIIHSKQPLTEEHHKYFLYQILRGVKAIHSAHVLHRDLKPGNLLVNKNCDLKVCDFGLARSINPSTESGPVGQLTEYVVTRWYRAPELLVEADTYGEGIDVWAIGCIFAEMLGRKAILDEDLRAVSNPQAVSFLRGMAKKPKKPWASIYPNANQGALDLLDAMLAFNPAKRISVADALAHPYLAPLHNTAHEPTAKPFSFAFDTPNITQQQLRDQIWAEMCEFHPEANDLPDSHRDDE